MKHRTLRLGLLALLMLFASVQIALAQFTATGKVTDSQGEGLVGATIAITGTTRGTTTDVDGNFRIAIPTNSARLSISYTGYKTIGVEVSSSSSSVNVKMEDDLTGLDEVVISGLATNVKRANLANSVATVSAKELTGVTVQSTMDGALYGKFRGAEIRSNSGAPGGGMSVRLRGVTSIFGNQQPLYIVDGVFLNNDAISLGTDIISAAAGGGNTSTNQDDASNRIADLDPEDIETVEILKGASAAAIYGSQAAGGVVLITTKRGKPGENKVSISQTIGFSSPTRLLGTRQWDEAKIASAFYSPGADETPEQTAAREAARDADIALFKKNGVRDYEKELYDNKPLAATTRLTFYGGSDRTNFFVGGTYKNEGGLVDNTGYEKISGRFNIGHRFNDRVDVFLANNYINSQSDRGFFNNSNSNTTIGYAHAFTRPWLDLSPDAQGNYPAVPSVGSNILESVALITNRENVNRYIGGATLNWRIWNTDRQELKTVFRAGLDQYTLRTSSIFPRDLSYFRPAGTLGGAAVSGTTVNTNLNLGGFLVYTYTTDNSTTLRTQLGVTQEDFSQNTVMTTATNLNGSQTSLDQAGNVQTFQRRYPQLFKGFFAQQEVNYRDLVVASVGVRGDKSSNSGDPNKIYYFPKANAAFNVHELSSWSFDEISQFKLRVAFGQSGRFPGFNDRFTALSGTIIGGSTGVYTPEARGNADIKPEIQSELEFGTDIGLFNNRVSLDITYYIKSIDDLLLRLQVPQSSGYTTRSINGGALENRGLEIGLEATPVKGSITWTTGINFWKNQSKVTRLDVPAFNVGGFAASLGQYRIQEGESATQIVGTYNAADCPDCDPDGDGFKVYGNAEPDFNMSFTNALMYKNFELNFLFHWKKGGDAINLSTLLWDLGQQTWDYDDKTLDPKGQLNNGDYRTSTWFAGNAGPWIEDAGYFRLREVGLYYTIPRAHLAGRADLRLGVSGRNLINIFDYNSYDPEVSNFGNNVLANTVEVTPFPSAKRINFHITATF
ncbi:MAG: SusC/RagA family TonB-linked outer membrane protein [Saprospiraceae bacterium]|nr:SusC/RagA family TonB-linked outer membrane protein [Saprospiraceae bacterium]